MSECSRDGVPLPVSTLTLYTWIVRPIWDILFPALVGRIGNPILKLEMGRMTDSVADVLPA